jgi:hypothetical protein
MRKSIIFCFLFLFGLGVFAQANLYFVNRTKHKVIEVKLGHQLSLKYKGYMGQTEFAKQSLTDLNDSMITLGVNPEDLGILKNMASNNPKFIYRKILIKDILAFRRITTGRLMLKTTLTIANIVGTYFLLTELYQNNKFSNVQTFFISLGVGISTSIIINAALPENPKFNMQDGWEVMVAKEKPKL